MIPKSGNRFPAFAKPAEFIIGPAYGRTRWAGEGRSEKIMRKKKKA